MAFGDSRTALLTSKMQIEFPLGQMYPIILS